MIQKALEKLSANDGRTDEMFRLGQLHANDGNWDFANKVSRGILKWKTIGLINHDRVLTNRDTMYDYDMG